MIAITLNGSQYKIPAVGEAPGWGSALDAYLIALGGSVVALGSQTNGLVLEANKLSLVPANAEVPGALTAADQTIGGIKTFARVPVVQLSHLRATQSNAQVMDVGVATTVIFETVGLDAQGEYDQRTGVFTANASGLYSVSSAQIVASYTSSGTNSFQCSIVINGDAGTRTVLGSIAYSRSGIAMGLSSNVSTTVQLAANETVKIVSTLTGDRQALVALDAANYFTIDQIL